MARVKIGNVRDTEWLRNNFAPAGYGLGVKNGHDCTDCNAAILNGTYYIFGESAVNHPGNSMQYGCMDVKRRGSYITQIIHYDYYEVKRFSKNDGTTWGEWEWVNPPMALGVEYRTTERYMGKPVYTKLVDCGYMPNATTKGVVHNLDVVIPIRCSGQYENSHTIPNLLPAEQTSVSFDKSKIFITSTADLSKSFVYVQLWYTKE